MSTTIEAEVVPQEPDNRMALAVRQEQAVGLFGTTEPVAVIEKATKVADALKNVIVKQGLVSKISGKEYPRCEAWTLLGTMLGVFPVTVWTKEKEDGWEARVEARTKDGAVIGAAEAECLRSERNWKDRDDFALRSMAQTRATAKCLRMPLGFVMTLAGFEATPAEEMTFEQNASNQGKRPGAVPKNSLKPSVQHPNASGGMQTPSGNRTPQAGGKAATGGGTSPATRPPQQAIFADPDTLKRMILGFSECLPLAHEFFVKAGCILETEKLEDLPLRFVPVTRRQFRDLEAAVAGFGNGEEATLPYPPNPEAAPPQPAKRAPEPAKPPPQAAKPPPQPANAGSEPAKRKDPEWFFTVVCPIPNKSQKRDDYMKKPDTILSLYRRMKEGDEGAQKRLWGFAKHWAPAERQVGNKVYQPTKEELTFREALDCFVEWEEKHGKDTAGQEEFPINQDDNEDKDVPF